jgi:hypothetical protein
MTYEQVAHIIFKEAKKAGYVVEERKSIKTTSRYYTISSGKCSMLMRVSDHSTNSNVITLRIDRKNTDQTVGNFIKNRLSDLGRRERKLVLGW